VPANPNDRLRTYRRDLLRGALMGILEVGALSFGLLAAIRAFDAPDPVKGALSAGMALGMFLAPYVRRRAARTGWPAAHLGRAFLLGSAACYGAAALAPTLALFAPAVLLGNALLAQLPSLLVTIYARNYEPAERGRRVSHAFTLTALSGALLSLAGGAFLDRYPNAFGTIFGLMAVAALLAAPVVGRMPSDPLTPPGPGPRGHFRLLREDRLFGPMMAAWMLLGFANLSLLPLRVERLANPVYGFDLSNGEVVFLTVFLFSGARVLGLQVFGWLFERMNFLVYRLVLNGVLALAMVCYFQTDRVALIGLGSVLFGLGIGGGNLAWTLWVTRIAPEERISEYMSVHVSMAGIRGMLAPFLAYNLVVWITPGQLSLLSMGLLTLASLLLLRFWGQPTVRARFARPA